MTRRATLAALSALAFPLARAAAKLSANVKWSLGSNLWNYFPRVPFTDILDVMRDTGFIGIRVTQFPQILTPYKNTQADMEREVTKRGLHVITISFNGPAHDPARRAEVQDNDKRAMGFLKNFGADKLVVFSSNRAQATDDAAFRTACECYNELDALAKDMGFRAGLHNDMGQMVQDAAELDRCIAMTDAKLFWLAPDTAHLYLAGIGVLKTLDKYRDRLRMAAYKDARHVSDKLLANIFDLGDGEDLDTARQGPRVSYERCGAYVADKLEPIYA